MNFQFVFFLGMSYNQCTWLQTASTTQVTMRFMELVVLFIELRSIFACAIMHVYWHIHLRIDQIMGTVSIILMISNKMQRCRMLNVCTWLIELLSNCTCHYLNCHKYLMVRYNLLFVVQCSCAALEYCLIFPKSHASVHLTFPLKLTRKINCKVVLSSHENSDQVSMSSHYTWYSPEIF